MKDIKRYTEILPEVGKLILQFARTDRATYFEDGKTFESDTDHTVMLSVCACALAEALYKDKLDIGKVSQFATVHDLVEAHVGDTDSFGISDEGKKEKDRKEHEALLKIKAKFDKDLPWIGRTIEEYEKLATKEARFVKTVDKVMSKITHILNNGQYFKNKNMDEKTMWNNYQITVRTAEEKYGKEFPEVLQIMNNLIEEARNKAYA